MTKEEKIFSGASPGREERETRKASRAIRRAVCRWGPSTSACLGVAVALALAPCVSGQTVAGGWTGHPDHTLADVDGGPLPQAAPTMAPPTTSEVAAEKEAGASAAVGKRDLTWRFDRYRYALGTAASSELSAHYGIDNLDSIPAPIGASAQSDDPAKFGGWVSAAGHLAGERITVAAPYGVVIGHSIAEGHPASHGELHEGERGHGEGQISRYLEEAVGYPVRNFGIGGQTSAQIRARWHRDVLGQEDPTLSPSRTLRAGTLPVWVYCHANINDIFSGIPTEETIANLEYFAQTTYRRGIRLYLANAGAHNLLYVGEGKAERLTAINEWLASGALDRYGVTVVDFNAFSRDPRYGDDAHVNPAFFADNVHPNPTGYRVYAETVLLPSLVLPHVTGVAVTMFTADNAPAGLTRPTRVVISGDTLHFPRPHHTADYTRPISGDEVTLEIADVAAHQTPRHVGVSHVEWRLSSRESGAPVSTAEERLARE